MPDSGAQMLVGGVDLIHSLGLTKKDLIPLATGVNAANRQSMGLLGGVLIIVTGKDLDGNIRETRQFCYISSMVHTLFLFEEACEDLGIIDQDFPSSQGLGLFRCLGPVIIRTNHSPAQRGSETLLMPGQVTTPTTPYISANACINREQREASEVD